MPRKQNEPHVTIFEQTPDEHGRIQPDRPLSAAEARGQDERNLERYLAEWRCGTFPWARLGSNQGLPD